MRGDADFYNRYFLAHALGQPIAVIEAMSVDDYNGHLAFLRVLNDRGSNG